MLSWFNLYLQFASISFFFVSCAAAAVAHQRALTYLASRFAVGPKDTPIDLVLEKTYDAKTGIGMPDL